MVWFVLVISVHYGFTWFLHLLYWGLQMGANRGKCRVAYMYCTKDEIIRIRKYTSMIITKLHFFFQSNDTFFICVSSIYIRFIPLQHISRLLALRLNNITRPVNSLTTRLMRAWCKNQLRSFQWSSGMPNGGYHRMHPWWNKWLLWLQECWCGENIQIQIQYNVVLKQ